jgi:hypothetical protein
MRAEEQKFLEGLPEGKEKEQWKKAYAAVYPLRDQLPVAPSPRIDPATCIEAFLLRLPPSADQDMWREGLELLAHQRPNLFRNTDVDPLIWVPVGGDWSGYRTMPDPRPQPIGTYPNPPYISWVEFHELYSRPLATDPILERIGPMMTRMTFGPMTDPAQPSSLPTQGGEMVCWNLSAVWLAHLTIGDRYTLWSGLWGNGYKQGRWQPGIYYPPMPGGGSMCWMSRLAV